MLGHVPEAAGTLRHETQKQCPNYNAFAILGGHLNWAACKFILSKTVDASTTQVLMYSICTMLSRDPRQSPCVLLYMNLNQNEPSDGLVLCT